MRCGSVAGLWRYPVKSMMGESLADGGLASALPAAGLPDISAPSLVGW